MYQKERLDEILELLHKYGYVTVKYLVNALHYSNATINRDLNILESQGEIHRTHGGVELAERKGNGTPFLSASSTPPCVRCISPWLSKIFKSRLIVALL